MRFGSGVAVASSLALIRPPAWDPPYATSAALKSKKKKCGTVGLAASWEHWDIDLIPGLVQWLKGPALPQLWLGLQLQLRSGEKKKILVISSESLAPSGICNAWCNVSSETASLLPLKAIRLPGAAKLLSRTLEVVFSGDARLKARVADAQSTPVHPPKSLTQDQRGHTAGSK